MNRQLYQGLVGVTRLMPVSFAREESTVLVDIERFAIRYFVRLEKDKTVSVTDVDVESR